MTTRDDHRSGPRPVRAPRGAALTCKADRKSDPAAFKSKYKRFSACVKDLAGKS